MPNNNHEENRMVSFGDYDDNDIETPTEAEAELNAQIKEIARCANADFLREMWREDNENTD